MADEKITVELTLEDGKYVARMQNAGKLSKRFASDVKRLNASLGKAEASMGGAANAASRLTASLRDWSIIIGQSRNVIHQLWYVSGQWMTSIIKTSAEIERMTYLMKGMSDAGTDAARSLEAASNVDSLFEMAKSAPFTINALSDSFVKFKSVGLDPLDGSMQSLVDATAAFGGTEETLHRASIAIQQMAGKGVISMEELRQQLGEAVPRSIELMARGLNTTYGELVKEISKGTVAARPALAAMFREFNRVYGGSAQRMMETFIGLVAKLSSTLKQLITQNEGMVRFFDAVKQQIRDLTVFLESPAAANFATSLGNALTMMVNVGRDAIDFFIQYREAITTAGKAFLIYWGANKLASFVSSMSSVSRAIQGQITLWQHLRTASFQASLASVQSSSSFAMAGGPISRLTRQAGLLRGSLRLLGRGFLTLGGPIGIAVSALWTIVDVLGVFKDEHDEALQSIVEGQRIADDVQRKQAKKALDDMKAELEERKKLFRESSEYRWFNAPGRDRETELSLLKERQGDSAKMRNTYLEWERRVYFYRETEREIAELQASIEESQKSFQKADEDWLEYIASSGSESALKAIRDRVAEFGSVYDQASIDIYKSEEMSEEGRQKALTAARDEYYRSAVTAWEEFISGQNDALRIAVAAGDENASAIITASLSKAKAALAAVFSQMNAEASAANGIPTVPGSGSGDSSRKSALEQLDRLIKQTARDAKELGRRMVDPFAYELPRAITSAEDRISKLAEKISGGVWTQQMKDLFNDIASNAATEELLKMADATRQIKRGLMGERETRKAVYEDEVRRIEQMRERLIEMGVWRVEWEKIVQERIKAARDQLEAESPWGKFKNEWKDYFDDVESWGVETFKSIGDSLADMVTEGKANFADLARSALNSFLKVQFNSLFSIAGGALGDWAKGTFGAGVNHSGGVAGSGGRSRMADMAMFAAAPRFHTGGVIGQEVPAILEKGEGVFTAEQMKAIGKGMSGPAEARVNIINNTGMPVETEKTNVRFNPEGMVLDVVLKAAQRPGPFRDTLKGALK